MGWHGICATCSRLLEGTIDDETIRFPELAAVNLLGNSQEHAARASEMPIPPRSPLLFALFRCPCPFSLHFPHSPSGAEKRRSNENYSVLLRFSSTFEEHETNQPDIAI